jgi:poly(3-hydroxyalkanoate) synthetase
MKTFSAYQRFIQFFLLTLTLSACHPTHFVIGNGAQHHKVVESRNKFLLLGLVHVGTAPDPAVMSNQATDYKNTVKLTFGDVVLNVITFGIYSPITVQVEY